MAFASLFELFVGQRGCDLRLESRDGVRLGVHAVVAAAALPALRRDLLLRPLPRGGGLLSCLGVAPKATPPTLRLRHVDAEELRLLLRFAYLGRCDLSALPPESLVRLLRAALRMQVRPLAEQIEAHLEQNLTLKAALELYNLNEEGLEKAVARAEEFLLRHLLEADLEQIAEVGVASLRALLQDDRLHARHEEHVWRAVETSGHLEQLAPCLRVGLLSEDFFQRQVLESEAVARCPRARALLLEAEGRVARGAGPEGEPLARPRVAHQTLLLLGGFERDAQLYATPVAPLEFYHAATDSWTKNEAFSMPWPRGFFAAAQLGEWLVVAGGFGWEEPLQSCQRLHLATGAWSDLPPMSRKRCYHACAVLEGELFVAGGQGLRATERLRAVEKFHPGEGAWSQAPDMLHARSDAALVNLNGVLFALGGFDGHEALASVEWLDAERRAWTFGRRMVRPRSGLGCVAVGGRLVAVGGFDGRRWLRDAESFDAAAHSWTLLAPMAAPRSNFGAAARDDRFVFVVGGFGPDTGAPLADAEVYDARLDLWYRLEGLGIPRSGPCCVVVDSLQMALRVWPERQAQPAVRGAPVFEAQQQRPLPELEQERSLEEPALGPLPEQWLRSFREHQRHPSPSHLATPTLLAITLAQVDTD